MMQHDLVTEADARHRARQLLSRPEYRRMWLARTISQVGDVAQFTTLALLLIALTGSGLLAAAEADLTTTPRTARLARRSPAGTPGLDQRRSGGGGRGRHVGEDAAECHALQSHNRREPAD